jgi:hypothetical protein
MNNCAVDCENIWFDGITPEEDLKRYGNKAFLLWERFVDDSWVGCKNMEGFHDLMEFGGYPIRRRSEVG